jgi:hypothetical protein
MINNLELLITQIASLVEMYKQEQEQEQEHEEFDKPKSTVGRPKKFDTAEERKKYHQNKLKESKYSSKYYNENKCRIPCIYCDKAINSLAKTSHYKSKKCQASREEPRILTSRIN